MAAKRSNRRRVNLATRALIRILACCLAVATTGPLFASPALASTKALRTRAAEMSEEAGKLFAEGKFREAAERIEQAYALDPGVLVRLRNAGRAWEEAKEPERAIHCFERFLERETDPALRKDAEERIARMRAEIAARAAPVTQPAAADPTTAVMHSAKAPAPNRTLPWVLAGAGAASAAVGMGWLIRVQIADGVVSDGQGKGQYDYPGGDTKLADDKAALSSNRGIALGLLGVGALAGGVAYWLWPSQDTPAIAVTPIAGTHRGLVLSGRF